MTFIKYTNDGKAVIQPAALTLSGLEQEETLEMHTLENAMVLLKQEMEPVEKAAAMMALMRLAHSLWEDMLAGWEAQEDDADPCDGCSGCDEDMLPIPAEAFADAGILHDNLRVVGRPSWTRAWNSSASTGPVSKSWSRQSWSWMRTRTMTKDHAYLYLSSISEAKRQNEVALWRASHLENTACKQAIEEAIRKGFDGMHLSHDCARGVIEDFGFKRVGWVLAATIQLKPEDGRFSRRNKEWAAATFIPRSDRNYEFMVESHAGVLDIFVNEFRDAQDALGMFVRSHCDDMTGQELEGKVLVMSPFTLKESYWAPENQLWLATGGFGCAPNAAGRAVYATCLGDGERTRWNRSDFIGILKEEHLPDWARESLEQIRREDPAESAGMTTPSM